MADIVITQAWEGVDLSLDDQDASKNSCEVTYIANGSSNDNEIIFAVKNFVPDKWELDSTRDDNLYLKFIPYQSVKIDERLAPEYWKVTVRYAWDSNNSDSSDYGSSSGGSGGSGSSHNNEYTFEVGQENRTVVYPYERLAHYNVAAGGRVTGGEFVGINNGQGVEVPMPLVTFTVTKVKSTSAFDVAYRKKVALMVGKINSRKFRGYSSGCVLFTGVSSSRTAGSKWRVTYQFAVRFPENNLQIGNFYISKGAWDLIWCNFSEGYTTYGKNGSIVRQLKDVYVDRVYQYADFSSLEI